MYTFLIIKFVFPIN